MQAQVLVWGALQGACRVLLGVARARAQTGSLGSQGRPGSRGSQEVEWEQEGFRQGQALALQALKGQ